MQGFAHKFIRTKYARICVIVTIIKNLLNYAKFCIIMTIVVNLLNDMTHIVTNIESLFKQIMQNNHDMCKMVHTNLAKVHVIVTNIAVLLIMQSFA